MEFLLENYDVVITKKVEETIEYLFDYIVNNDNVTIGIMTKNHDVSENKSIMTKFYQEIKEKTDKKKEIKTFYNGNCEMYETENSLIEINTFRKVDILFIMDDIIDFEKLKLKKNGTLFINSKCIENLSFKQINFFKEVEGNSNKNVLFN